VQLRLERLGWLRWECPMGLGLPRWDSTDCSEDVLGGEDRGWERFGEGGGGRGWDVELGWEELAVKHLCLLFRGCGDAAVRRDEVWDAVVGGSGRWVEGVLRRLPDVRTRRAERSKFSICWINTYYLGDGVLRLSRFGLVSIQCALEAAPYHC
jgi:hypothetical protein